MKLPRRTFLAMAAGAAALPVVPRMAWAQAYPSKPVRIVVGFPPGGATDIQARLMGQWLSERLGQQFIVDNRAGASGNIGTEAVAKAPADGYTGSSSWAAPCLGAHLRSSGRSSLMPPKSGRR